MIMHVINVFLIILPTTQSTQYYIKEGEVPSYMYQKFDNIIEEIFPSFVSITAAFSAVTGTLFYSIDKNMNQLIVTMRDDIHDDTRYGLQIELNTQLIIVSLSRLCALNGTIFDERDILTIGIIIKDKIILECNHGTKQAIINERRRALLDNYPIMYSALDSDTKPTNEAHLWIVNHPMIGNVYPNRNQMYGCIFDVFVIDRSIIFTNITSNIGDKCKISCRDDMCNGGQCFVIYSEQPICNCTKAFRNGDTCNDGIVPMNFETSSQRFVFKMFKLSWKSMSKMLLEMNNRDIQIRLRFEDTKLIFEYNFADGNKSTKSVILSNRYVPDRESICIVYYYENMIDIRTYINWTWNSTWLSAVFDMRQADIDKVIFRSGDGLMDFVYKISPEYLWSRVDFIKKIPLPPEIDYNKWIIIGICLTIGFIAILVFIIIRWRKSKNLTWIIEELESEKDRPHLQICMKEIAWSLVDKNSDSALLSWYQKKKWEKSINENLKTKNKAKCRIKLGGILNLIRDTKEDMEYYWTEIIVLFVHARIFVLPYLSSESEEVDLLENQSLEHLTTLLRDKYKYGLYNPKYFLECLMELLKDLSENNCYNDRIYPFVEAIMRYIAYYTLIGRYKFDTKVKLLDQYFNADNDVAVWAAVILCKYDNDEKYLAKMETYLAKMETYLAGKSNKKEISEDAMVVYVVRMRNVANKCADEYEFAEFDYQLIEGMHTYKVSALVSDIIGAIVGYIINICCAILDKYLIKSIETNSVKDSDEILIKCLCSSLLYEKINENISITIQLISLLDKLYGSIAISETSLTIANEILDCLGGDIRYLDKTTGQQLINICEKYRSFEYSSENIRVSASNIIGRNSRNVETAPRTPLESHNVL